MCLGMKYKNTIIEDISESIVKRINPSTACITDFFINNGSIVIIIISRIICSIILLVAWGSIFCLPAKYPFNTDEMDTNGKVKAKASNIGDAKGSFKRFIAIKSLVNRIINIRMKLIERIKNAADVRIRIDLFLFSDTNFEMEIGMASVAIVKSSEYVGVAIVNKLIPYSPMIRV